MSQHTTDEYKKSIVMLYMYEKTVEEIEKEQGVSRATFYRWLKKYREIRLCDDEIMTADDIRALQLKVTRIEEENLILKKAIALFTREPKNELQ